MRPPLAAAPSSLPGREGGRGRDKGEGAGGAWWPSASNAKACVRRGVNIIAHLPTRILRIAPGCTKPRTKAPSDTHVSASSSTGACASKPFLAVSIPFLAEIGALHRMLSAREPVALRARRLSGWTGRGSGHAALVASPGCLARGLRILLRDSLPNTRLRRITIFQSGQPQTTSSARCSPTRQLTGAMGMTESGPREST